MHSIRWPRSVMTGRCGGNRPRASEEGSMAMWAENMQWALGTGAARL